MKLEISSIWPTQLSHFDMKWQRKKYRELILKSEKQYGTYFHHFLVRSTPNPRSPSWLSPCHPTKNSAFCTESCLKRYSFYAISSWINSLVWEEIRRRWLVLCSYLSVCIWLNSTVELVLNRKHRYTYIYTYKYLKYIYI